LQRRTGSSIFHDVGQTLAQLKEKLRRRKPCCTVFNSVVKVGLNAESEGKYPAV
jgi:hypothetical protein